MLNQFYNLSCYEEFEIQCTLTGVSKIDILKKHANKIDNYYFFIFSDDIFNWFDSEGNHVEEPGVLKEIKEKHIPLSISKCIIPNSVISIGYGAFCYCTHLKKVDIPDNVIRIDSDAFWHCESLETITIPDSVTNIGIDVFYKCTSLKEVIFKGKTLEEVKQMMCYPFGIKDKNIIKCKMN